MTEGEPEPIVVHPTETVLLADLRDHPRNYRDHPDDQVVHLSASVREHGLYKAIVVARDGTILAGHGVAKTLRKEGVEEVPVVRLDLDPYEPRALKILAGDNESQRLGVVDDRLLSELLREISRSDDTGLVGTGFDDAMLANLLFVTRPASEIVGLNEAAQWIGLPSFDIDEAEITLVVHFDSETHRDMLVDQLGLVISKKTRGTWSTWWPVRAKQDLASLRFDADG